MEPVRSPLAWAYFSFVSVNLSDGLVPRIIVLLNEFPLIFIYMSMSVRVYATHVWVHVEARRRHQVLWNWLGVTGCGGRGGSRNQTLKEQEAV